MTDSPLAGVTLLLTRAAHQASVMAETLARLGADCYCIPTIAILPPEDLEPLDHALDRLADYHWILFTSANAVRQFFERYRRQGGSWPPSLQVAAIGKQTSATLDEYGVPVNLQPERFVAESLLEAFPSKMQGQRILFPRAKKARELVPRTLRQRGAEVDVVTVYVTGPANASRAELDQFLKTHHPDAVIFTSASTVEAFFDLVDPNRITENQHCRWVCIGPITARALEERGHRTDIMPDEYTADGLIAAITAHPWR